MCGADGAPRLNPVCVLKVYELTLHYTQHWDHNVVTAALELLQQTFRTPPPELLHMLITAGSIQHATVFRQDPESRARSGSILELIGESAAHTLCLGSTANSLTRSHRLHSVNQSS